MVIIDELLCAGEDFGGHRQTEEGEDGHQTEACQDPWREATGHCQGHTQKDSECQTGTAAEPECGPVLVVQADGWAYQCIHAVFYILPVYGKASSTPSRKYC